MKEGHHSTQPTANHSFWKPSLSSQVCAQPFVPIHSLNMLYELHTHITCFSLDCNFPESKGKIFETAASQDSTQRLEQNGCLYTDSFGGSSPRKHKRIFITIKENAPITNITSLYMSQKLKKHIPKQMISQTTRQRILAEKFADLRKSMPHKLS